MRPLLFLHYLCNRMKCKAIAILWAFMGFAALAQTNQPATLQGDSEEPEVKPIPYAWRNTLPLGERYRVPLDTLLLNFYEKDIPIAYSPSYATTGNIGAAGFNNIYFERPENDLFFFKEAFYHWMRSPSNFEWYNTRLPFTQVAYHSGGSGETGQDDLSATFSANINKQIAEDLKNHWQEFKKALRNLETVLKSMKIEVSRFANSWNVLLPIIYFIYYNPEYEKNLEGTRAYLVRAVLFTYFQSGTTSKLQQMKSSINSYNYEITVDMMENQISDLRVTDGKIDDILNAEKGSRVAGEVLYFLGLDWINKNYKYEQDHLHPDERFNRTNPVSVPMEEWNKWRSNRNRLPNLHLLEGRQNASKNDMRLVDYYNDMNDEQKAVFRKEALIPDGVSLELEHFGEFYEKRKALLMDKIRQLLG